MALSLLYITPQLSLNQNYIVATVSKLLFIQITMVIFITDFVLILISGMLKCVYLLYLHCLLGFHNQFLVV